MKRRIGLMLIMISGLAPVAANAQTVDFELKLWEMRLPVADALEKRLADGGDAAAEAVAKMPDLIKRGTVQERESVEFKAESGKRNRVGAQLWEGDSKPKSAGVSLEHDVVVSASKDAVEMNWYFERHEPGVDGIVRTTLTDSVSLETSKPTLLQRFEEGGKAQLLVATVTADGAAGEDVERNSVWLRGELFKMRSIRDADTVATLAEKDAEAALAKAKSTGELVIAFGKRTRSGQRAQTRREVLTKGGGQLKSYNFEVEPYGGKGRIDLRGEMMFHGLDKKRGGAEVTGKVGHKALSGGVALARCIADRGDPETPYVFALRGTLIGPAAMLEPETPVVAAKRPAASTPDQLYVASYEAPPDTLRVWSERFKLEQKITRELCEAGGVAFVQGASVFFNPNTCTLTARLDEANHAALAKLINSVLE